MINVLSSNNMAERPEVVIKDGLRLDGRGFEMFRSVFMRSGLLSKAAGSAYAEFNTEAGPSTKVVVGVYGPRQSERREAFSMQGRLQCDFKLATFATRQQGAQRQDEGENAASARLQALLEPAVMLEKFPKAVVDVHALVLESGGSDLAIAACAASLALADAGIEMLDLVSACSVSRVEGQLLLDPTADESYREDASALLAMMPSINEVTDVTLAGEWAPAQATEALQLAMGGCAQLDAYMRQTLHEALEAAAAEAAGDAG